MVIAVLVQRIDMVFAEGYDPRKWDEGLQDCFTMQVGELPAALSMR